MKLTHTETQTPSHSQSRLHEHTYTRTHTYTHAHKRARTHAHTHTHARARVDCVCKLGWIITRHIHKVMFRARTHTHTYIHARTRVRLASRTSVRFCSGSPSSSNAVVYGQFCDCVPHSECNIRVAFTGTHLNAESVWQLNPFLNWTDVCSDSSTNYDSFLN